MRAFIVNKFLFGDACELTDDTPLLEHHIMDSTGVVEMVNFLEETFGILIEDTEVIPENLNSFDRIARFVEKKKSGSA